MTVASKLECRSPARNCVLTKTCNGLTECCGTNFGICTRSLEADASALEKWEGAEKATWPVIRETSRNWWVYVLFFFFYVWEGLRNIEYVEMNNCFMEKKVLDIHEKIWQGRSCRAFEGLNFRPLLFFSWDASFRKYLHWLNYLQWKTIKDIFRSCWNILVNIRNFWKIRHPPCRAFQGLMFWPLLFFGYKSVMTTRLTTKTSKAR